MEKQYMKLTSKVSNDIIINDILMAAYEYTKAILEYGKGDGKEVVVEITIKEIKDVV